MQALEDTEQTKVGEKNNPRGNNTPQGQMRYTSLSASMDPTTQNHLLFVSNEQIMCLDRTFYEKPSGFMLLKT